MAGFSLSSARLSSSRRRTRVWETLAACEAGPRVRERAAVSPLGVWGGSRVSAGALSAAARDPAGNDSWRVPYSPRRHCSAPTTSAIGLSPT